MRHFRLLLPLTLLCLASPAAGQSRSSQPDCPSATQPEIVCVEAGALRGATDGNALAFKAIPYARAPVGSRRWRPPEEGVRWEDIRDATEFGAICPQLQGGNVVGSEDCLTLNVWRPKEYSGPPLPVMVWLTGGGNHSSSGSLFDASILATRERVVVVTYNQRLGVLGFLAHPSLDAERPERVSGNYGSLDQIAMLRWVQRNIEVFGGDPDRVFLFGTSAGGANICALMTSPLARGLFHGASMQSSVPTGCELQTLSDAQQRTGARVVQSVGCDSAPDVAACLRGKSVAEMVAAVPGTFGVLPREYGPNVDGHVFPEQPIRLIERREHQAMPIIIGTTSHETVQWASSAGVITDDATYTAAVEKTFGQGVWERILGQYPIGNYANPAEAFVRLTTDALFTCQSRRVARTLAGAQTQAVYRYLFSHALQNSPNGAAGHSSENRFLFRWPDEYQPTQTDLEVRSTMMGYWSRMAASGDPNGGGASEWRPQIGSNDSYVEIGATTRMETGPSSAKCDFWDTIQLPWPHL